jgi:hypothetical protein
MKCGGAHKMKSGGQTIVGGPGYNAKTNTMKKGGIKKYNNGGVTTIADMEKADRRDIFRTPSSKLAAGILGSGFAALAGKIGFDKSKAANENKKDAKDTISMLKKLQLQKKGGSVKNAKLAALAPPKNKVTRADVIAGALKNKRKR